MIPKRASVRSFSHASMPPMTRASGPAVNRMIAVLMIAERVRESVKTRSRSLKPITSPLSTNVRQTMMVSG